MSQRKRSMSVVIGLLVLAIGAARISFAASTDQHGSDPQVVKDANETDKDGLTDFGDITEGQILEGQGIVSGDPSYLAELIKLDDDKLPADTVLAVCIRTGYREGGLYAFFSGPFDRSEIEGRLTADDGFAVGEVDNVTTYTTTKEYGEGIRPLTFGFLDRTLLMACAPAFAGLVAKARGEDPNVYSSPPLGRLLADGDKGQLYIAFKVTEKIKAQLQKRTVTEPLSHAQAVSLSVGFTDENLTTLAYQADTIANAATIAEKFQGLARSDDKRTRDDRTLAIALSNLLKLWNPDIQLYDALNTFLRMGQVIIGGESLRLSKIEDGPALANGGSDAGRIRKLVYVPSPGISIPDLLKRFGISTGLKE